MSNQLFEEFEGLANAIAQPETIEFLPEQVQAARDRSGQSAQPWSTYCAALALQAFTNWLSQRDSTLIPELSTAFDWQAKYSDVLETCLVPVQGFRICLIPSISLSDDEVVLPRAVLALPEFAAHFYVVVGVEPDLELASIRGWHSYESLSRLITQLEPQTDWTYLCPLDWFTQAPLSELLLYLRCLDPSAIALPAAANPATALASMKDALLTQLAGMSDRLQPLWQQLTWEQGAAVLASPPLLSWLQQAPANPEATSLTSLLDGLSQQMLDFGQWLRGGNLTGALQWEPVLAAQLRGEETEPAQRLAEILTTLQQDQGLVLPEETWQIYRELELGGRSLSTYGVLWREDQEWMLLLIVQRVDSPHTGTLTAAISTPTTSLMTDELDLANVTADYLALQVAADPGDCLLVTLTLATGESLTLEPFILPEVGDA